MAETADKSSGRKLSIHQSLAKDLGIAILSGQYPAGMHLPSEIEQSETLGVSRLTYREAMKILSAKGLIESRPKVGSHVTPRDRWNVLDPDILAWMFMDAPDPTFVDDLFELRGLIEPAAAELAARRRTEEHVRAMRQALDQMAAAGLSDPAGQAADRQFHWLILEAAGNLALGSLASSVGAAVQWTTYHKHQASKKPRDPRAEHEAVYDAIAAADPQAAADGMRTLLKLALEDMRTSK